MPLGIESATFNVLIGAVIAMFSSAFLNWNQRRVERDRFRRSLIHEMRHIGETLEQFVDEDAREVEVEDVEEVQVALSPDVLDSEFAQTTKLTTNEIEYVYEFYESARIMRRKLERQQEGEGADTDRLYRFARRTLRLRDESLQNMKRSRLSQFTERYKDVTSRKPEA